MQQTWDVNSIQGLLQFSRDLFCSIDHQGVFVQVSPSSTSILGYSPEDLVGMNFLDLIVPGDREKSWAVASAIIDEGNAVTDFTNTYCTAQGDTVVLNWSVIWDPERRLMHCLARPWPPEPLVLHPKVNREQLLTALVSQGSDMQGLLNEKAEFLFISGSTQKFLGYRSHDLLGRLSFDFLHPEDQALAKEALATVLSTGQAFLKAYRFRHANGEWRWLESVVSNQLQYPGIQALVLSSRDITQNIKDQLKLQESEQRFKVLFMNNPDPVLYQDKDGLLLDMNAAAETLFGIKKERLVHQPIINYLPDNAKAICQESLNKVLTGECLRFELALDFPGAKDRLYDISKYPVYLQEEIIGVYSTFRDVTDISQYNQTIQQQAEKLAFVFDSISDAFLLLDRNEKINIVNRKFEEILTLKRQDLLGKNVWEVFPEEVGGPLYHKFYRALETRKGAQFETFLNRLNIWLKVKAFPSDEGISLYFSDITEKKAAKKELEKLSLVASKIQNSVVITDAHGRIEWVNDAFTAMTGYALQEILGQKPEDFLRGPETDPKAVRNMNEKFMTGDAFNQVLINYTKSGEKYWVSIDVTPIRDEHGNIIQYIAIQKNITERKETEARQMEMTKDLFQQNRDLQQFTYIISHNLRAPVANALGLSDLLTKIDTQSPMFQTALVNLKKTVFKMDTVLRDLNMILSVRDKQGVEEFESVDVASVIEQAAFNFQEPLANCKAVVDIDIEKGLEVKGNRAYLHSIFYNLFSNALKYRSPDRLLEIKVKCYSSDKRGPAVTFSDNGTGFDMAKAGNDVFKLYKRFHKNKNGRGIGLFLVKTHIEAMGGAIEVTSQEDVGTRFLIHFGNPNG